MSYDVWLTLEPENDPARTALATFAWLTYRGVPNEQATEIDVGHYTSNVAGMWHKALGQPLQTLTGQRAGGAVELLSAGLMAMEANQDKYRTMDSPNGWGDFAGAHDYLFKLLVACLRHPEATIHVCC